MCQNNYNFSEFVTKPSSSDSSYANANPIVEIIIIIPDNDEIDGIFIT